MSDWKKDKRWSDRFLPEIKGILGQNLIVESTPEDDAERNTDLIVLRLDAVRIACRVRNHSYLERYANDFTIRSLRPSGMKTELAKIREGWGDYFFYGFSDNRQFRLAKWILGNLDAFRVFFEQHVEAWEHTKQKPPWDFLGNRDNSSSFMVCDWRLIPEFIVASFDVRDVW